MLYEVMPGEQGHSTMAAMPGIPTRGLPIFNPGGNTNGTDSRIRQAQAPRAEHSNHQQSFVPQTIAGNGIPTCGNRNGYARFIGVIQEIPPNRARFVDLSSKQRQATEYCGNRFTRPPTYQSVHVKHIGAAQSGSTGERAIKKGQFTPTVYTDFHELPTAPRPLYKVPLPSYNFATQTLEHRVVDPTFVMKSPSKTPVRVTKPSSIDSSMPQVVKAYSVTSANGAGSESSVALLSNDGRKSTSNPHTPKKRTPKKVNIPPHSNYDDSINRAVILAREQADMSRGRGIPHPQRPASAVPCEPTHGSNVTKQRTRHRSSDADAVPRKARKKHAKTESGKGSGEHSSTADISNGMTPSAPQTSTRRVSGQYPERIIITNKPACAAKTSQTVTDDKSRSPRPSTVETSSKAQTVMVLPRHESLRSCLLGNVAPTPHQSPEVTFSTAVGSSSYSESFRRHGPRVFKVDSVIPSTEPVIPDSLSSAVSNTPSNAGMSMEQPLDYSMKTLRQLEKTAKPHAQYPALDLSLGKQESTVIIEKSTATAGTVTAQYVIPPTLSNAVLTTFSSPQPTVSHIANSVCQPSKASEVIFVTPQISNNSMPTASVNSYPIIHQAMSVPYQIDTFNLDTLCDVALATTPSIVPSDTVKGNKKGQRNSRKKQNARKVVKKSDTPSKPKPSRKKSKSVAKKEEEKHTYIVSLNSAEASQLAKHSNDSTPSDVNVANSISRPIDSITSNHAAKTVVLTARVDEVQVSDDEESDATLDADERPDSTSSANEINAELSDTDTSRVPESHSGLKGGTEQIPMLEGEANVEPAKAIDAVPKVIENSDTVVVAEEKDEIVVPEREEKQPLRNKGEDIRQSDVIQTVEKAFVESNVAESKGAGDNKVRSATCPASRSSPNVTIHRLNSNEMRSNFSVSSQDGVIAIRPESLDSIMKPKAIVKTEPTSSCQDSIGADERDPKNIDASEMFSPKQDAGDVDKVECSEVASFLNKNDPGNNRSFIKIKSESEEVPFLPRFSCHSPIDLNEACCDEYDNMCRDFDVREDDCVEIITDSSELPKTASVEASENISEVRADASESVEENEIVFSPSPAEEVADTEAASRREKIAEKYQARSKLLKKRKKKRRFRLSKPKKKAFPDKTVPPEEITVQASNEEKPEPPVIQENTPGESPAVEEQARVDQTLIDSDIKPDIPFTPDNSVESAVISATNLSNDVEISPNKRKSLKLGYSLNSEFGIGDLKMKRRKLIKKDEKPIIVKPATLPVVKNIKPICLFDSSESSDEESSIFKTEKAKQLVKKSNIQQKMALKESQKILKKAKDFMVKKEPNRLLKKCLLKSGSVVKSKRKSKSLSRSLSDTQSTENQTNASDLDATTPDVTVDSGGENIASPVNPRLESPRSPFLRPNGSRFVLTRGSGPWLVTRRETLLVRRSPSKINTEVSDNISPKKEDVKLSPPSEDSDTPRATIQLKSFVRDPKAPEDSRKPIDDAQRLEPWISNTGTILNQTITNKSLEKKVEDKVEKRNSLRGIKSLLAAKTNPTISNLKVGMSRVSKLNIKASKENFDPDRALQVEDDQYTGGAMDSETCEALIETHEEGTFPFTLSPNESYDGDEEEPQPFVLTSFAKDVSLKTENAKLESEQDGDRANSSVAVKSVPEITQTAENCEAQSLDNESQHGNSVQLKVSCAVTTRYVPTAKPSLNEVDSKSTQGKTSDNVDISSQPVVGDTKLLSLARLLPPPPLKEECISPPTETNNRKDGARLASSSSTNEDSCYTFSEDDNCDISLRRSVIRASSNVNNNNIFDTLHGKIPESTETPTHSEAVDSVTVNWHSCASSTSGVHITSNKNTKARIKGTWTSRDFATTEKARRPSYFKQVKISKAKRDKRVYRIMQKMLNMGLIVDKASQGTSDMARWPTSFDKYDTGETGRNSAPSPPWLIPEKNVKREFISEEDVLIKPCSVSLKRLEL